MSLSKYFPPEYEKSQHGLLTVANVIVFPRYNMKCSRANVILRGIFHVVSCCPLHFMSYRGNLDYFLDSDL